MWSFFRKKVTFWGNCTISTKNVPDTSQSCKKNGPCITESKVIIPKSCGQLLSWTIIIHFWLQRFFWGFCSMLLNNRTYSFGSTMSKKMPILLLFMKKIKSLNLGEVFLFYDIIFIKTLNQKAHSESKLLTL